MESENTSIEAVRDLLLKRLPELDQKSDILKAVELKSLYSGLAALPIAERAAQGKAINALRDELVAASSQTASDHVTQKPFDVTAPFAPNTPRTERPRLLPTDNGTIHPLMRELAVVLDIFYRMGFTAVESREIDDDYHMFGALNFPLGHPARDDYDTFMTEQTDSTGRSLIAPAHTSTMQHRMLRRYASQLEQGEPIAVVMPGRVFRNEDLDARHEHTFYQLEGVYVAKGVHAGMLIATLKTFLQTYYGKTLEVRTQPYYFPFTEPSFEFALSCPFCDKQGCQVCSYTGWIELLGCGMIHPNVLREAGIDPTIYTGFAWGSGIEDVRHFESGRLDFLRQF
jgi:phenylalanyl-tRNA synthetase alpha chain